MPLLTPQLFQKIKAIIQKHHQAFVVNAFGQQTFPPEVVKDLKQQGLITEGDAGATNTAYLYGQVRAQLEDPKVASWSLDKLNAWTAKNPVDLTADERAAARTAQLTAAQYCVGLGNTVDKRTGQLLIEADHALRDELQGKIQDATALNIAARETVGKLKSDLGWESQDWARDLDRIAITEKHNAMEAGVADGIQRKAGADARVALICMPDACDTCKRLTIGPDGQPRIFRLSQLGAAGANVGRKQAEWVAVVGATHPHCQCRLVRVPTGWGFDEDGIMRPGGKYGVETEDVDKSMRLELAYSQELRKALSGPVPEEELAAFMDSDADLEEWEGCCRDVLTAVAKDPGVQFPKLTDRVSARWGEELGGQVARALAKTGALRRDVQTDRYYPALEKARKLAGKVEFQGLPVSVEQAVGDSRSWYDRSSGESGKTVMRHAYGYIRGTEGVDGDHVDVFLGPNPRATHAYVVHQKKKQEDGSFRGYDEDKCMLGFSNPDEAKAAYLAHYNNPGFFGSMSVIPMAEFKRRVLDTKDAPRKLNGEKVDATPAAEESFLLHLDNLSKADGVLNDFTQGEADRSVVTGGGPNIQMDGPPRPLGGVNDATGMAAWLLAGQPRTSVIYRDPKVYEFDQDNPDAIFTISREMGVMPASRDGLEDFIIPRQMLERQVLASGVGPRNTSNVGWNPMGSARLADAPVPDHVQVREPGETQASLEREKEQEDVVGKALFIGPRGGRWADAAHTVAYDEKVHGPTSGHAEPESKPSGQGKGSVTVHAPGGPVPPGVKWGNHPGPGYRSTLKFKGQDYHVTFGHEGGKFTGTLQIPGGKMHAITSPNHAANMVMLHSKGLEPTLNSYEMKKLGIAYPAARLFRFGESTKEAARPEPAPEPVVVAPEADAPPPEPIVAPAAVPTPPPTGPAASQELADKIALAKQLGYETAQQGGSRAPAAHAGLQALVAGQTSKVSIPVMIAFSQGYQKHAKEQEAAAKVAPPPPAPETAPAAPRTDQPAGWDRMPEGRVTSNAQLDPDKKYVLWTKVEAGTRAAPENRWISHSRPVPGGTLLDMTGNSKRVSTVPVAHGEDGVFPEGYDPNTGVQKEVVTPPPPVPPPPAPAPVQTQLNILAVPELPDVSPAMDPSAAASPAESRQRAREIGEHITSSRKDQADIRAKVEAGNLDEVSYSDAARFLRKESVMPVLDAVHYQQAGASPGAAHMALTIAALVGSKPPDSDEGRKAYLDGVRMVAGGIQKFQTVEDAETFIKEMQDSVSNAGRHERQAEPREVEGIQTGQTKYSGDHPVWDFGTREALKKKLIAEYNLPYEGISVLPPGEGQTLPRIIYISGEEREAVFNTLRALGPRFLAGLNLRVPKPGERRVPVRYFGDTAGGKALRDAKWSDSQKETWDVYLTRTQTGNEEGKKRKTPEEKIVRWKQSISELPDVAGTKDPVQKGDPVRFKDKFGFTGVQPGENLPDDEYEYHLRHAEMAFSDLADVLAVPPQHVSMNGRLSVAFAARGRGKAAAHYEPGTKAINITRFKGAGTIAHEWGHFLDNVSAEMHGGRSTAGRGSFASEGAGQVGMPVELAAAFEGVRSAMKQGDPVYLVQAKKDWQTRLDTLRTHANEITAKINVSYRNRDPEGAAERATEREKLQTQFDKVREEHNILRKFPPTGSNYSSHAAALDGYKSGGYWSEGTEMFARAFESYVQDKIEDTGTRRNSYLVDGTRKVYEEGTRAPDGSVAQRYPQGEERKRINAAFDHLLGVLRSGGHLVKALAYLDNA